MEYLEILHKADGSVLVFDDSLVYEDIHMLLELTGARAHYWVRFDLKEQPQGWGRYRKGEGKFTILELHEAPAVVRAVLLIVGNL